MDTSERLTVAGTPQIATVEDFALAVRDGLSMAEKSLPCVFFYDEEGSILFEQICDLPEYYPTRAEDAILREHADEIARLFDEPVRLVELGSGSATKTRRLIEAFIQAHGDLRFTPIDVSESMLVASSELLLDEYDSLDISAFCGTYNEAIDHLAAPFDSSPEAEGMLILWLGSSIGNLDRDEAANFLRHVRRGIEPGDRMLIGIDLRKDTAVLEAAYDDARGVTARFNLNLLSRINRELGGHFDIGAFRHTASWNEFEGVVQMHLESTKDQSVTIDKLGLTVRFAAGERIHTENSYKYSGAEIEALAERSGFALERQWTDDDERFSVNLFAPF